MNNHYRILLITLFKELTKFLRSLKLSLSLLTVILVVKVAFTLKRTLVRQGTVVIYFSLNLSLASLPGIVECWKVDA
jgi:hypothetical protein